MPSIFKAASVEPSAPRWRAGVSTGALLFLALVAGGICHAIAADAWPAAHGVKIENMKFSPAVLTVRIGDRVEFKNDDLVPHSATAKPSGAFDSGPLKPGDSWTFVARSAGRITYTCSFHPTMTAEINVQPR